LKSRAERESDVGSADKYLYNDFIDPWKRFQGKAEKSPC
jgi:hypothetical protein